MATNLPSSFLLKVGLLLFLVSLTTAQDLEFRFYRKTCPPLESVVRRTVAKFLRDDHTLAAPLLRMFFHDCFVRGCDGSVLLNSTESNQAEKDSIPNKSLRGFEVIDAVKAALEEECSGVVSCADILALVARDAVSMALGPRWQVPLGRRDGVVSSSSEALVNLPPPFFNITQLKEAFLNKNLTVKDLVVLSGAHTIGVSHCLFVTNRIYNFTGNGDADPTLDPDYVEELKKKCAPNDTTTPVEMDPKTPTVFDTDYYTLVSHNRGLFQSDAALLDDSETSAYVTQHATKRFRSFFFDFGESMVNLGNLGVLTGNEGEIRNNCAVING